MLRRPPNFKKKVLPSTGRTQNYYPQKRGGGRERKWQATEETKW